MKINVDVNKVSLNENYYINQGEINVNILEFIFSEEYNNLIKKAVFKNSKIAVEKTIFNDKISIAPEVLTEDRIELRVFAYDSNLNLRYSPTYLVLNINKGSYIENTIPPKEITPSQFDQYEAELNKGLKQAENVNIKSIQLSDGVQIITIDRNGTQTLTKILNGPQGPQGPKGDPGVTPDLTDYVKNTDYATTSSAGVVKCANGFGLTDGATRVSTRTYEQYQSDGNAMFISKGTLENVLAGKKLNTNYSTDETVVGTFLSKPLYRKVISLTKDEYNSLSTGSNSRKLLDVSSLNVDNLVNAILCCNYSDVDGFHNKTSYMHRTDTNGYELGCHEIKANFLNLFIGNSILTSLVGNANIILEYTKTTDVT